MQCFRQEHEDVLLWVLLEGRTNEKLQRLRARLESQMVAPFVLPELRSFPSLDQQINLTQVMINGDISKQREIP